MSLYVVFVLIAYSEIRPIMTNSLWTIVCSRIKNHTIQIFSMKFYGCFNNEIMKSEPIYLVMY